MSVVVFNILLIRQLQYSDHLINSAEHSSMKSLLANQHVCKFLCITKIKRAKANYIFDKSIIKV